MAHFGQSDEPMEQREPSSELEWPRGDRGRRSQYRREELIRIIEHSIQKLTLQELESLYYDMSTKKYIND
jgi:hypothetical protein